MSGWIKFERSLLTDPRIRRLARTLLAQGITQNLNASVALALGAMATLWTYADEHVDETDHLAFGPQDINDLVGIPGFTESLPADWLQILDAESVHLPNFHAHNGSESRRKAQAVVRQLRYRNTNRQHPVTHDRQHPVTVEREQTKTKTKTETETETKTKEVKSNGASAPGADPSGLDHDAWQRWEYYRKEIKKPLRAASVLAAKRELAKFGDKQGAVVEHSIANGYQGLFAPKPSKETRRWE